MCLTSKDALNLRLLTETDSESASLILDNYYESVGGREFVVSSGGAKPKKKRGRQISSGVPDSKTNGKKAKKAHPASSTPPASVTAEWKPPTGSWEEDIASIDAIEECDGKLSVYVQWSDGRQSQHEVRAMYSHCPQKVCCVLGATIYHSNYNRCLNSMKATCKCSLLLELCEY